MRFRVDSGARSHRRRRALGAALATLAALVLPSAPRAQLSASPERLDEIVVTSSLIDTPRRQIGTAVSTITADEIELRGYESLGDLLRTQPGISVSNAGGLGQTTTLRIRGEEAFRTLLVIDGVKVVDPSAPQVAPAFDALLSTPDVERVEILRGPQGFLYGADAGGVVNVLTSRGQGPPTARVDLESGAYGTRRADATLSGGGAEGDYFVSAARLTTDGFNSQTVDTVLGDADGADNTTLHVKLGWTPTDRLRLQWVAHDVDASTMFDGCFSAATFAMSNDCVAGTRQRTQKVSLEQTAAHFDNVFGLSAVDIARDDAADGAPAFATRGKLGRFEYTGSFKPSASTALVYGVDLQQERVASGDARERGQRGYYFEYQGRIGEALYLSAGTRYDDNDDFGAHFSSRVTAAYVRELEDGKSLKYRASLGTGFRAPSLYEMAYNRGPFAYPPAADVTLGEETSGGYDLGVDYDTAGGLHAEVTYFHQRIDDEVFFDLLSFSGYLQTPGRSRSKGVELAALAPLGAHWRITGNWTYNWATDTSGQPRLRRPRNLGNIGVLYEADALRFAANYRLSRDALDVGGVALDDYGVLDLSVEYRLSGLVAIYGRIENATDERYQELVGYNTARRAAYVGVRLRF
jgi:vitamin B12 transporter